MTGMPDTTRMKAELAALVAFDTQNPPGREIEAGQYIVARLAEAGFDTSLTEYKSGRTNVVARLARGPGPVFAFNTHIDVVPAGEGWSSDPFTLTDRRGKLYGRGACDAKGPLAAMLEALRMLKADPNWSGTLLGVFTADEETASEGARHYAKGKPRVDFAVIGEPTSNATVTAHKGSMRPTVCVHGRTAHSGTPHLGLNAIYEAAKLTRLVEQHHAEVVSKRSHPLVGNASLTITRIHGGHADNVIPDRCELLLDRRMVPGEDEAEAAQEIKNLLAKAGKDGIRAEVTGYRATTGGPTETERDAAIVAASLAASQRHGATDPGPFGFQGGCDLVHFRSLGATGVVVGPGDLGVAHKPDEFVPADEFIAASLIYRDIALSMLG
jgi:acetylornithine deacetylase/succinyl-diaminopimelate desuccinylase family protein